MLPKVPGETAVTADVPLPIKTAPEVSVAAPVPPPATPNVPLRVRVPAEVIGPPVKERPLIAVVALTEVTEPAPPAESHSVSVAPAFNARSLPPLPA